MRGCAAHLLRDLRSISEADPDGQLWATAMANTLLEANHTAGQARASGAQKLDTETLRLIRNHYLGALARGDIDNQGEHSARSVSHGVGPFMVRNDGATPGVDLRQLHGLWCNGGRLAGDRPCTDRRSSPS